MRNKRILQTVAAAAFLLLGQAAAFAHNGIEHISGKVTAKTETSVTVETVDHTRSNVLLDPATTFTMNEQKASLKDLKVGDRVAVNAKESAGEILHGISIKWKSGAAAPAAH